ncbi:hypothetical protein FNO01nite_22430 [Flavobacterium noncentrifugens]|uniref:DUF4260 domain-containing protein n=1 Tax=Flavobacterium noncentrifugens TaxID=1128970 RepID=A0A1G9ASU1_9FLAO|nr:DUF4260 domain-containing protein [Flavobacterium noncentrifugens]GEP51571.1 hypothetical protein FNO01nite_22430 [Flavobacterium noncentrifugens]SDK30337.1 protein of unknown function [Flavobacterium noncentrifugens]
MKTTLKLEEFGMFVFGIWLFSLLNYQWWWFLALIFAPDFSMIGYAFGNKTGAFSYNLFHHRGLAILVYLLGIYLKINALQLIGIILFSHASLDRIFGYGLKYENGFQFTHLGKIGKEQS